MFDIGFLEILVILVIALLVIGPERMPEVARKLGSFMGKTKRFINSVKEEGELHDTVRELKKSMDLQEEQKQLHELEQDLQKELGQPASEMELDLDEFKRPTFGGQEQPVEAPTKSQFSRAPSQPAFPSEAASEPQRESTAQASSEPALTQAKPESTAESKSDSKPEPKS